MAKMKPVPTSLSEQWAEIASLHLADEQACVETLIDDVQLPGDEKNHVNALATRLVEAVRAGRRPAGGVDAFMQEYDLSSEEGVVLMCLAESLLRIPDSATIDKLIRDKIEDANWTDHLGKSDSLLVNASTWGLMLTGQVLQLDQETTRNPLGTLSRLVSRSGEPIIRQAVLHAVRILGGQFVLGRTIEEALNRAEPEEKQGYWHSYDMLGESAYTKEDATRYFEAYVRAIKKIGARHHPSVSVFDAPSISVKLSALHPRYEPFKVDRLMKELAPRVFKLAELARERNLGLTIDAEEAERLESSLRIFEWVARHTALQDWQGLGLAVQAYQKRAPAVLKWLKALAIETGRRFPTRLVKGAYWDSEIKHAQEAGLTSYPVFTRKESTDISYLACAKYLLANDTAFYPQFATHNAHTVAAVHRMAHTDQEYEFQRLHGMGSPLYEEVVGTDKLNVRCRIYAPVGSHENLLAYLVRRLLENGANTSFVNRLADDDAPIESIVADPVDSLQRHETVPHPALPVPEKLFGESRKNSHGVPHGNENTVAALMDSVKGESARLTYAAPLIDGLPVKRDGREVATPANLENIIGEIIEATADDAARAVESANKAFFDWSRRSGDDRAAILDRAADLFEDRTPRLMALAMTEAGKTFENAIGEIREAVDFLRYYATRARIDFSSPTELHGPTGERNDISFSGRGVFVCIAPWNFPLAIFTGQVSAALAAGNTVVAKPAEQTPLVAFEAVRLLHEAGVPGDALQFLPGPGETVGAALTANTQIAGVAFTGSTDTASLINKSLAGRNGPIVPLIAETGGQNAMIVDSTALPEQVTKHAIASAFDSAGQRCSAARVLFVQRDIAPAISDMIKGAMEQLAIGDPLDLATDIGPVIDSDAVQMLDRHTNRMSKEALDGYCMKLRPQHEVGTFFAPHFYEIDRIDRLTHEVFGPCLHMIQYEEGRLEKVCKAINGTGFGLTLSVHTRIDETIETVRRLARVGNLYVNRNQIGAVVGVQPFGGEGLSGTGPKAGGPHYLHRFAVERSFSQDTTASGGNAALMTMQGNSEATATPLLD